MKHSKLRTRKKRTPEMFSECPYPSRKERAREMRR